MTAFHHACYDVETVEMIIKNCAEFNIDLNIKDNDGKTAFHQVCEIAFEEIAEMIIENSVDLNIDLNAKTNKGETAFHVCFGPKNSSYWLPSYDVINNAAEMLEKHSAKYNIDLTVKDNDGRTAYD